MLGFESECAFMDIQAKQNLAVRTKRRLALFSCEPSDYMLFSLFIQSKSAYIAFCANCVLLSSAHFCFQCPHGLTFDLLP